MGTFGKYRKNCPFLEKEARQNVIVKRDYYYLQIRVHILDILGELKYASAYWTVSALEAERKKFWDQIIEGEQ